MKVANYLEDNCPGVIRLNLLNLFPDIFTPGTVKDAKIYLDWLKRFKISDTKGYFKHYCKLQSEALKHKEDDDKKEE
eukprot:13093685-Ditylum_brightwellii.AAC.1